MPLFFVIFIINFPAGLILYWITTNAWTMLQQYVIRRRVGPITPITSAAASGTGGSDVDGKARAGPTTNGAGSGGLSGLLRGRVKPPEEKEPSGVAVGERGRRETPPPRPPRKKKKRSGRRR
jgi:YidC/Oxa1 family membrane protein insertase